MPTTGCATCREFDWESIDFMLPQGCPRRVLRYLDALAEAVVLPRWCREIELAVTRRVSADGSPETTRQDVDLGFAALVNSTIIAPRPQFLYLLRRPGFRYSVPGKCPPEVRRHFHEQVRHFMNIWATEIEQLANRDGGTEPVYRRATVDLALSAAVGKVLNRRRRSGEAEPRPPARRRRQWFRPGPPAGSQVVEFTVLDSGQKGDPFLPRIPLGQVAGTF
jgi:hypothetical protein